MDEQRLILINGTNGAVGSVYGTEQESFSKIEAIGSNGDSIMPNPNSGKFTVTLSKPVKNANILLLNNTGSVIERKKVTGSVVSFNISNRASGTYYVWIDNKRPASVTFNVIKQ